MLLMELTELATRTGTYTHRWQVGDLVLWDNRRTMHAAFGHPADQVRIVHRTTIKGDVAMGRIHSLSEGASA